jgi:dimethylargininase
MRDRHIHDYREALEHCGLSVTIREADVLHSDATFVEDTAALAHTTAILIRSGAESREGEVAEVCNPLGRFFRTLPQISAPGTLDGRDICDTEKHFFIGISQR